jgi:uncharacterized protein (DUF885 family)
MTKEDVLRFGYQLSPREFILLNTSNDSPLPVKTFYAIFKPLNANIFMKRIFSLAFVVLLLSSCNNNDKSTGQADADAAFRKLADEFVQGYLAWRPLSAVSLGFHEYDGKLSDYSKASIDAELKRLHEYEQKLAAIDTSVLSTRMFYDFRLLRLAIRYELFNYEDLKLHEINPMQYAYAVDVNVYIKRNYAPLEERLGYVIAMEKKIPGLFASARNNLRDSLPKTFVETATLIIQGSADFLKNDLPVALKEIKNDSLMASFRQANEGALAAMNDFAAWLQKEKLPKANNAYAIGRENYVKMLSYAEDINLSPEEILKIGLAELKLEQERFSQAAKMIDPSKKPVDVLRDVQKEHPTAESLIPDARKNLELIRQFTIDRNIVTMPSEVRVKVQEMPKYLRSQGTASMDVPGPFEKKATEAYYNITPVEPEWTPKQKEEWLAMFDYYTTDNVSIHEAYPGHYTQFLHLNASDATVVEKIFGSYAFIEGWAHYTEKMMMDEGFGKDGDSIRAYKYRLAQSGDALLRICRLCVSVKMHCQGMTVDEGTKFFMDNWYQGEKPAAQEALRGTFDPGYLFYTVGKLQILKLREDYQKQEGSNYSLKKFHDEILDHGMPPVRLLREILLKDKKAWNDVL